MQLNKTESFGERAVSLIRRRPALFEALLDYEKTRKFPKLVYRERLDITINGNLLKRFRRYCKEHGYTMSRLIELCMIEEIGELSDETKRSIKKAEKDIAEGRVYTLAEVKNKLGL